MNRINWITYLKILYDAIEKIQVSIKCSNINSSFLSINVNSKKDENLSIKYIEKINRDNLVKALFKVINLLPLMNKYEYEKSYATEYAITFNQVYNQLMCNPLVQLTWDDIMDILLYIKYGNTK